MNDIPLLDHAVRLEKCGCRRRKIDDQQIAIEPCLGHALTNAGMALAQAAQILQVAGQRILEDKNK